MVIKTGECIEDSAIFFLQVLCEINMKIDDAASSVHSSGFR